MYFYAYDQVSQYIYIYNHIVFSFNKENFKKYVLPCILVLIISLLESRELGLYFKNSEKIILFSFNIWGYDLIRKTYSEY
jgi:hypothetical protein